MFNLHLYTDWKDILKKAWSIRLMILAGILTAIEAILPMYVADIPQNVFSVLSLVCITAAMVARLVAQRGIKHD